MQVNSNQLSERISKFPITSIGASNSGPPGSQLVAQSKRLKLFWSYSHDSENHKLEVRKWSERFRRDGKNSFLDQYISGVPSGGWARWMVDRLIEDDVVLVVCTERYYNAFRGKEFPGMGYGADFEGAIITQEIYDSRSRTKKFITVIFDSDQKKFIPEPLRSCYCCLLTSEKAFEDLRDVIDGVAGVEPCEIGPVVPRQRRRATPHSFDRTNESGIESVPDPRFGWIFEARSALIKWITVSVFVIAIGSAWQNWSQLKSMNLLAPFGISNPSILLAGEIVDDQLKPLEDVVITIHGPELGEEHSIPRNSDKFGRFCFMASSSIKAPSLEVHANKVGYRESATHSWQGNKSFLIIMDKED